MGDYLSQLIRVMKGVAAMRACPRVKESLPRLERGRRLFEVLTVGVEILETQCQIVGR